MCTVPNMRSLQEESSRIGRAPARLLWGSPCQTVMGKPLARLLWRSPYQTVLKTVYHQLTSSGYSVSGAFQRGGMSRKCLVVPLILPLNFL